MPPDPFAEAADLAAQLASALWGLSMLCSWRLSALPKKLYVAQLKVPAEVGDVLLAI